MKTAKNMMENLSDRELKFMDLNPKSNKREYNFDKLKQ